MKLYLFVIAIALFLFNCKLPVEKEYCPPDENSIYETFQEASQPIINKMGFPESVEITDNEKFNFHQVQWYYDLHQILYSFIDEPCDGWNGWHLRLTYISYTNPPIPASTPFQ
jgi:hypothetical protein